MKYWFAKMTELKSNNLKHKAVSGVIWTSIQRFLSLFIQFISGIVLARLLSPDDYGCIGMLMVFTLLANTIVDGGFSSALIQKKEPTQEDYSTIFFWNVGFAVCIYMLLFAAAPYIAEFYNISLLCPVLRVQGITVIIGAMQTVQVNMLNKQFRFKKISIVTLVTSIISLGVTIILAYRGFGVWALVAQNILVVFIPTIIYWATNKWKPSLIFSLRSFKELFSFGVYMFLTSLMTTLVKNVQSLLIGRFYNASTLGYFSKAAQTEKLASTSISQVMGQVTYPLYAEMQDDKARLGYAIKRITVVLAFVTFPLMMMLILVAKPLFILLYSEKWIESVPYFQALCISGMALCLHSVNGQAIAAIGKSKAMFIWSIIKQSIALLLLVVGLYFWGMTGLLCATVFNIWFVYFVNASLVSHFIRYRLARQLLDLAPAMLLSFLTFAIAYYIGVWLNVGMYISAIIQSCIYIAIYTFFAFTFKFEGLETIKTIIVPMLKSRITSNKNA